MREILFRGKTDNGEWVEGYYVYDESGQTTEEPTVYICYLNQHPCGWALLPYKVIPETVGQYTGLTDKNGTKIFEGDIFVDKEDEIASVVEFRNGMFCLVDYGITGALMPYGYDETAGGFGECDCQPMDNYNIYTMQIDGNIHDNPELLKGGADNG